MPTHPDDFVSLEALPCVMAFLQANEAMETFHSLCRLAGECYPDLLRLEATLLEDLMALRPLLVVLTAVLPNGYPLDRAKRQERCFHSRVVDVRPRDGLRFLAWELDFARG
jgi:hypothetical protein